MEDVDAGRMKSEPDLNLKSSGKQRPDLRSSTKLSNSVTEESNSTIEYEAEFLDN